MNERKSGRERDGTDRATVGFVILSDGPKGLEVEQFWANLQPEQKGDASRLLRKVANSLGEASS